jgi:tetratricopeptide (TPR) repeat protein
MMVETIPQFLDVDELLDRSQPVSRGNWLWYAAGGFFAIVMVSAFISSQSEIGEQVVKFVSPVLMLLLVVGLSLLTVRIARRHRAEIQKIEAVEELVQLRRWPEAAVAVQDLLARPTHTPVARVQGLIFLGAVLARYHRFEDVIRVYGYLLDHFRTDDGTARGLRFGRAMAMLREDHLFDADAAISELRRGSGREPSAGLLLVMLYRDVKTGHPQEAIDLFEANLPALRDGLGFRVADAYALAAHAYDQLGHGHEAKSAWEKATVLSPVDELVRRYPELARTAQAYPAAVWPGSREPAIAPVAREGGL